MLGLRKGEMFRLTWVDVDLDTGEITVDRQFQRVGTELLHRETKTAASDATLLLPDICAGAVGRRRVAQIAARDAAGPAWQPSDLIFITRYGRPVEPRNFNRFWDRRGDTAGVRRITVRDARRTWPRSWPTWTPTPGWRCRSSATRSSPSRWRSTRCPRRPPVTRSSGSATRSAGDS